jgi:hypothetical protein
MTRMSQITSPKPLIITILTCQDMMDNGMDEHGMDWIYGCHMIGFWLYGWAYHS